MPSQTDSCETVVCGGLQVKFRRAGAGSALVLVHGLLGYSFSWRNAIPILARHRQVFAPDMPGAGFSECRRDLDCRLASAADRLLAFLDAISIDSCDLVGSSHGGATAAILAGLSPSRVRSLVLVSPANPRSRIGRRRLAALKTPALSMVFPAAARAFRPLHGYFVRRMWGDPRRISAETLEGYAKPLMRPGVFEHAVRIVGSWRADMEEFQAALSKISVPTLIVWGSKDRVVDPASAELLKQNLNNAQITIMEGAGHLPYEECPEEFCQLVQAFLRINSAPAVELNDPHER